MNAQIESRNNEIVRQLTDGTTSIVDLGKKYNISRERVSQIYYKETGKTRGHLRDRRVNIRHDAKEDFLNSLRFVCDGCGTDVTQREGHYKRKYCSVCHELSQYKKRALDTTYTCSTCGKDYHPFANSKNKRRVGYFCSLQCYYQYPGRKKNG